MTFAAVVEIALPADAGPKTPISNSSLSLLKAAYEASERGVVLLVIPDGTQPAIDRALDSIVAQNRRVRGLVYRETSDPALMNGVAAKTLVIAETPRIRAAARGIVGECLNAGAGLPILQSWAGHDQSSASPAHSVLPARAPVSAFRERFNPAMAASSALA